MNCLKSVNIKRFLEESRKPQNIEKTKISNKELRGGRMSQVKLEKIKLKNRKITQEIQQNRGHKKKESLLREWSRGSMAGNIRKTRGKCLI